MANIYLKVPTYVAQFYRGRDVRNRLSEFQPVEFSPFQDEYAMLSSWLTFVAEQDMDHTYCFSERMWKNMLNGRKPQGGKVQLKRDAQEWPSIDEVNFLTGVQRNRKTDGFDYLCIAAPKSMVIGGQYKQVTASFTLPFRQANALVKQLRREFIRILLNWVREEMLFCDQQGIDRDLSMCVDHFFYHYNMCIGTNATDRDSMRRMAKRWLEDAKMLPVMIDDEDTLMVYEKEGEKRKMDVNSIIKNVK